MLKRKFQLRELEKTIKSAKNEDIISIPLFQKNENKKQANEYWVGFYKK